jgi:hypothetical protein
MNIKWETDAEKLDVNSINNILFRNNIVDEFINYDNKYFIVASKGIGKTLLLNFKRYELEKRYSNENDKSKAVIFIPTSKPYLDHVTNFGFLTKDQMNFLSKWNNCKMLWELAIEISTLSYYHRRVEATSRIEDINANIMQEFGWSIVDDIVNPTFVLCEILKIKSIKNIMKFMDSYSNKIRYQFTNIPSGAIVFIDRVDQSLLDYKSDVWIAFQIGLLEASWDLMRMNHHVKIYTSIRQEAYANYTSPNKAAISGELSLIKYSTGDLKGILNKLSEFYEEMSFDEFIGFSELDNYFANKKEKSFDYIYRHTIGRPRDLVSICSKLSPERENLHKDRFREIVNSTASSDIVTNVFSEVEILLDTLKKQANREKFLSLLPYNVLTLDEIKDVCRKFNELVHCPNHDCKTCNEHEHPFCELFNIGLLGVVKKDHHSGNLKQKFVEPYEMNQFSNWVLPMDSPYYLVHPSLHVYIDRLRNRFYNSKYNMIQYLLIGNNYTWDKQNSKLIDAQKIIFKNVLNEETREQLLHAFKEFDKPEKIIDKLKDAGKTVVDKTIELSRIIELILKVYETYSS